jgi:serine O-acetyltransferase
MVTMFDNLKHDYSRYLVRRYGPLKRHLIAVTHYGFLAVALYRYGRVARNMRVPVVSHLMKLAYLLAKGAVNMLFGISINVNSNIGPGLYIGHFGGIFMRGEFGRNLSVAQCVTIGARGAGKSDGWPVIGDDVYIGAGAKVIGRIRVGNRVVIGANAVVIRDVPDDMLAVGVPAMLRPRPREEAGDGANTPPPPATPRLKGPSPDES